jgi:5-methylcytosine-specific restriction endonuclease McrA
VSPLSKGGGWSWDNLVTACVKCNGKKGNSTLKQLGWKLLKQPTVRGL